MMITDYLDPFISFTFVFIHSDMIIMSDPRFCCCFFTSQPFRPVWACCVRAGRRRIARLGRSDGSCDWSSRRNRRSWSWGWVSCRRLTRLNSWNWRTWGRWGEEKQTHETFPLWIWSAQETSGAPTVPFYSILNVKIGQCGSVDTNMRSMMCVKIVLIIY